jgi:hypothetical protein
VESKKPHPLVGLLAVATGIAFLIAFSRPWTSIGSGLIGGGGAMLFNVWAGPLDRRRRRKLAPVALGGLVLIFAVYAVIQLTTTRHTTARISGDVAVLVAIVGLVFVLAAMVRRLR